MKQHYFGSDPRAVATWVCYVANNSEQRARELLDRALDSPTGPDWTRAGFYAGGVVLTVAVTWARTMVSNFPFHPLGIILGTLYNDWSPYWGPFLVAWIAQRLTLRYGSLPAYRRMVPFFLGAFLSHTLLSGVVLRVIMRLKTGV